MAPQYIRAEEVPADIRERERRIHDGSDVEVDRKMVLMAQPFVRDPKKTIGEMIHEAVGKLGENIVIRRFTRYELGEAVMGDASDTGDDGAEA
jgi:elongation factor Ts